MPSSKCTYPTYVRTHVRTYVGTYARTYVRRHVCTYVRRHVCTRSDRCVSSLRAGSQRVSLPQGWLGVLRRSWGHRSPLQSEGCARNGFATSVRCESGPSRTASFTYVVCPHPPTREVSSLHHFGSSIICTAIAQQNHSLATTPGQCVIEFGCLCHSLITLASSADVYVRRCGGYVQPLSSCDPTPLRTPRGRFAPELPQSRMRGLPLSVGSRVPSHAPIGEGWVERVQ